MSARSNRGEVSHPDLEWQDEAACIGTKAEVFFPEQGRHPSEAKRLCQKCPVRPDCLDFALRLNITHGVWGGHTESERLRIRRSRGRTVAPYQRDFVRPVPDANHGTRWAYEGRGCRCDACVATQRDKRRDRVQKAAG